MISVISSFSDSTTGENTTTGYVNRLFVKFCDISQKAIDITGYGTRPCGVKGTDVLLVHYSSTFGSFVGIFDLIYGLLSTNEIIMNNFGQHDV